MKAIRKFGIHHPVINDADFTLWKQYAVRAWPTTVIITPNGYVAAQHEGENVYKKAKPVITSLLNEFEGQINNEPVGFRFKTGEEQTPSKSLLHFPSKMITDPQGNIWLADSGNNRILKLSKDGKILEVIGSGKRGRQEGNFETAAFNEPHGLALKNDKLYIADTKNNTICLANLSTKTVSHIAGNGELSYYFGDKKWGEPVMPNSPWDLLIYGDQLIIANAGNHQILKMNLKTNETFRMAGSGREALIDGSFRKAAFNQPSGLTMHEHFVFVADAEASAVRVLDIKNETVTTLIGSGLFNFGDKDGPFTEAELQHAVGILYQDNKLLLADTYNHKVKVANLSDSTITTLAHGLNEPNDMCILPDNKLLISSTNNHKLVMADRRTGQISDFVISQQRAK